MEKKTTLTSQIRIRRCSACGSILQSADPSSSGYISKGRDEKGVENGICDRCYNLRHYNSTENQEFGGDYIKILKKATDGQALVVFVLDLFSLESSLIPNIGQYLGNNVLVVLNKRDVFPKATSDEEIIENAQKRLFLEHIHPQGILLVSAAKQTNIELFLKTMDQLRKGKDVYFIGTSGVGKSSLVNAILRNYTNDTARVISTNTVQGTKLEVMEIPLDDVSSMYDTPGIFNPRSILNQLDRMSFKYIVPREEIKPRSFSSNSGQAFIFGAVAVLEFVEGKKTDFSFLISDDLAVTRTKSGTLERTFRSLAQTGQAKPVSESIKSLDDLEKKEIAIPASGQMEISVFGLGTISFSGANQRLAIYLPKNVGLKVLAEEKN
jgi:ribosome biogenesis GTPase YqeH